MLFKRVCRFPEVKKTIEEEIYDQDGDIELSVALLGLFSFTDRPAVEFSLRLLRNDSIN